MAADREAAAQIIEGRLKDQESYYMPEMEANEILQAYGFPVLKSRLIENESDLEQAGGLRRLSRGHENLLPGHHP